MSILPQNEINLNDQVRTRMVIVGKVGDITNEQLQRGTLALRQKMLALQAQRGVAIS